MKRVLLIGLLFSMSNLFANYSNVYTCTSKEWITAIGNGFVLVQDSINYGLNLQDENSTIKIITHTAGELEVTSIRSLDGLSYGSKQVELRALKEDGENQYDVTITLSSRKLLQNSDKFTGTLEVKRLLNNTMEYGAAGMVERVSCQKQF